MNEQTTGATLVNFVTEGGHGYSGYHRVLMRTEYKEYLQQMYIPMIPHIELKEKVITVVYKKRRFSRVRMNSLVYTLQDLRKFCEDKQETELLIPIKCFLSEGFDYNLLLELFSTVFNKTGINVTFA